MTGRILSLDGGGNWCFLQAMILGDLYPNETGHQILNHFDIAIANSGGAVILACLLADLSPKEIVLRYLDGQTINRIYKRSWFAFPAKWSTKQKLFGLKAILPTGHVPMSLIGDTFSTRIMFPAFDVVTGKMVLFDSYDRKLSATLAEAVHATSTAPVLYFDKPAQVFGHSLWDGGVTGLNNPAAYAVAAYRETHPDTPAALSIGSATVRKYPDPAPTDAQKDPSLITAAKLLVGSMVDDPPNISLNYLKAMTDGKFVRLNPVVGPEFVNGHWVLPDAYNTFGGFDGYITLANAAFDVLDMRVLMKLYDFGMAYLANNIPSQIHHSDRITAGSADVVYTKYKGLRGQWLSF